jgi:hypothetical protein
MSDLAERAREIGGHVLDSWQRERVVRESLAHMAQVQAEARLEEAKWWRHLVIMHDESYFAVEGDKRIAALEQVARPGERS